MAYIGNNPTYGDTTSNFKLLDDISTYTLTFDGSSSAVVSTSNYTITQTSHRFITGQRVTYSTTGSAIGGLTSGTAYYIIKNDQNTVKLALTQSDAINSIAINLTALGTGTTHTLNVAFDGVNTKFKATYDNGTKALFTAAAQLQISINGVIQKPQNTTTPATGFGFDLDSVIIFPTAPGPADIFWGNIIANNFAAYDISDNVVDNFTGNGSQLTFTLSQDVPNSQSLLVTIDGVVQYPSDGTTSRAYSAADQELIFTSAPGNGTVIQARHIGFAGAVTSNVTGFYGRTGNAVLTTADTVNIGAATIGTGGIGTSLLVQGNARITGILTIGTGSITLDGVNNTITGVTQSNLSNTNITGIATFTNGPVLIGSGTSTGTAGQVLQATGGAYVSGNTGIGTTIPQYKLDVLGDINFTGTFYQNSSAFVASRWTAGTGNDIYRLSGNIGIGTTRPTSKLQIQGDALVSGIVTATSFSGGGANLTSLTAGNLSGTIPSGVLGNSTLYVGTTAVTLNRSSASQSLTGINIDGSSGSCTGNSATATTATNQSGGTVSATTGSFSGQLQLASPSTYSAITSISIGNNYPILAPEVNAGSGGFTPIILQKTVVTGGYRQVLSMGSYRAGTNSFNGGVFIAPGGGSDNNPTDYFLLSYGGSISYSGGSIGFGAITSSDTVTLTTVPFFRNTTTIASNYTVTTTYNEMSIGPITINNGITVTVNSGATWTVV